jgi:hypothetical protein
MKYINLAFFTIGVTLIICFFVIHDYYSFDNTLDPIYFNQDDLTAEIHAFKVWKIYIKVLIGSIVLYTLLSLSNFIFIKVKQKKQ